MPAHPKDPVGIYIGKRLMPIHIPFLLVPSQFVRIAIRVYEIIFKKNYAVFVWFVYAKRTGSGRRRMSM